MYIIYQLYLLDTICFPTLQNIQDNALMHLEHEFTFEGTYKGWSPLLKLLFVDVTLKNQVPTQYAILLRTLGNRYTFSATSLISLTSNQLPTF